MKTALLLTGLLWALTAPLAAFDLPVEQDPGYVLIQGHDASFRLTIPPGWAMGGETRWKPDAQTAFHPVTQAYGAAFAYIFAGSTSKRSVDFKDLPSFIETEKGIEQETRRFKEVVDLGTWKTNEGIDVKVLELRGQKFDKWEFHQALAFLDAGSAVVWFYVLAVDDVQYEQALPAFKQVIASYKYLSDKPQDVDPPWYQSVQYFITPNARMQARMDPRTTFGRNYAAKANPELQDLVVDALAATTNAKARTENFELIVQVGTDGTVQHVWAEPKNDATLCLLDALKKFQFDQPPVSPFHLQIQKPGPTPTPPPDDIKTDD